MVFDNFRIVAYSKVIEATCKCGNDLKTTRNGIFKESYFCKKCKALYELKLVKVPTNKISEDYMDYCEKL